MRWGAVWHAWRSSIRYDTDDLTVATWLLSIRFSSGDDGTINSMHGARKRRACGSPARSDLDLVKYAGAEMYLSNVHGDTKLTNTQNGKSVTLQLAEASHDEFFPDGSSHLQVSGATIIWAQPPDFVELTLLNGQRAMYFDAGGNLISDVVRGSRTNLCDVLAG